MHDILFELGSEELPASFIVPVLEQLQRSFQEGCKAQRIQHGAIRCFGTPRRLAIQVSDVADRTEDMVKQVQGPSVDVAFDAQGNPKVPLTKFAASAGVPIEKLIRITTPKGIYLAAQVEEKGRPVIELLPEILGKCVSGIVFPKSMRWGDLEATYARPLHWIVALFGSDVVPVVYADVRSGNATQGHRFLAPAKIVLNSPQEYESRLEAVHVVADIEKRKKLLIERIDATAKANGALALKDDALIDQVANLVELPNPIVGTFDPKHLDLPPEVLIQEMQVHQRYFPMVDAAGKVLPKFIAVSNTPVRDEKLSVRGYERVLRARLTDGRFFFDEDRRIPLTEWLVRLQRRAWVAGLGSMVEKSDRIKELGAWIADHSGKSALRETVQRAATLCKADLETGMVNEFPELQGVMGREYALHAGESADVATAVFEHYLPRGAGDGLPTQDTGAIIGLADRLDSLCGLFGIGRKPTGTKDDFALRRAAITFIRIAIGRGYRFSLSAALGESVKLLGSKFADVKKAQTADATKADVLDYFRARLESLWREDHRPDVVEAVLSSGFDDLVGTQLRVDALTARASRPDFAEIVATFKRVSNIVAKQANDITSAPVDAAKLIEAPEKTLFKEVEALQARVQADVSSDNYANVLDYAFRIKPAVDAFFDGVMVMTDDKPLRENRVRLLMHVRDLLTAVADFSKLQS